MEGGKYVFLELSWTSMLASKVFLLVAKSPRFSLAWVARMNVAEGFLDFAS